MQKFDARQIKMHESTDPYPVFDPPVPEPLPDPNPPVPNPEPAPSPMPAPFPHPPEPIPAFPPDVNF